MSPKRADGLYDMDKVYLTVTVVRYSIRTFSTWRPRVLIIICRLCCNGHHSTGPYIVVQVVIRVSSRKFPAFWER